MDTKTDGRFPCHACGRTRKVATVGSRDLCRRCLSAAAPALYEALKMCRVQLREIDTNAFRNGATSPCGKDEGVYTALQIMSQADDALALVDGEVV